MNLTLKYLSLQKKEMAISDNLKSAINDYKWIVRVLESSETKEHLNCCEKCYNQWDTKYFTSGTNSIEKRFLIRLRNSFWSKFHHKRISMMNKKKLVSTIKD